MDKITLMIGDGGRVEAVTRKVDANSVAGAQGASLVGKNKTTAFCMRLQMAEPPAR